MKNIILCIMFLFSISALAKTFDSSRSFLFDLYKKQGQAIYETNLDMLEDINFAIDNFNKEHQCNANTNAYAVAYEVQVVTLNEKFKLEKKGTTNKKVEELFVRAITVMNREVDTYITCMTKFNSEIENESKNAVINFDALELKLQKVE